LTEQDLLQRLTDLRAMPSETEWVEFKAAQSSFSFKEIGRIFLSAEQ
jgi:hypothetical protein